MCSWAPGGPGLAQPGLPRHALLIRPASRTLWTGSLVPRCMTGTVRHEISKGPSSAQGGTDHTQAFASPEYASHGPHGRRGARTTHWPGCPRVGHDRLMLNDRRPLCTPFVGLNMYDRMAIVEDCLILGVLSQPLRPSAPLPSRGPRGSRGWPQRRRRPARHGSSCGAPHKTLNFPRATGA